MIKQANFTHSPLGKAFEKQIKTIEDKEEKQIKAIKDQGEKQVDTLKALKSKELEANDNENCVKYKKIFDEISDERIGEICNISKETDFNNLIYYFKGPHIAPINFVVFKGPVHIHNEIMNGDTTIKKLEEGQKQFKSKIKGNNFRKSKL